MSTKDDEINLLRRTNARLLRLNEAILTSLDRCQELRKALHKQFIAIRAEVDQIRAGLRELEGRA